MVQGMPSVGCILYHRGLQAVLLVRQFRPPVGDSSSRCCNMVSVKTRGLAGPASAAAVLPQVYAACLAEAEAAGQPPPPLSAGFTLELCAGLVDKTKSLEQIVKEEVGEGPGWGGHRGLGGFGRGVEWEVESGC